MYMSFQVVGTFPNRRWVKVWHGENPSAADASRKHACDLKVSWIQTVVATSHGERRLSIRDWQIYDGKLLSRTECDKFTRTVEAEYAKFNLGRYLLPGSIGLCWPVFDCSSPVVLEQPSQVSPK